MNKYNFMSSEGKM